MTATEAMLTISFLIEEGFKSFLKNRGSHPPVPGQADASTVGGPDSSPAVEAAPSSTMWPFSCRLVDWEEIRVPFWEKGQHSIKEHNIDSTEQIALYVYNGILSCVLFLTFTKDFAFETFRSKCPRHKNAYEKTLWTIHTSVSDNNESSK